MCLIMLAWRKHADIPMLLAANRDEAFARPSTELHEWQDPVGIIGGRDTLAGGAWLAIHKNGRFGVVTNFREPEPAAAPKSRGELIPLWLSGGQQQPEFAAMLEKSGPQYAGFNLLYGDLDALYYATNRAEGYVRGPLPAGTYALSNALLDTPWPKVTAARAYTHSAILLGSDDPDHYFNFLRDRTQAPDEVLPAEPGALERRRLLSAPFILGEQYGTRCSTLLSVHSDRQVRMTEQHYLPGGASAQRVSLEFSLD
ncbi:MAG: NRDE family protein [Pseudomonadota bacterium]